MGLLLPAVADLLIEANAICGGQLENLGECKTVFEEPAKFPRQGALEGSNPREKEGTWRRTCQSFDTALISLLTINMQLREH